MDYFVTGFIKLYSTAAPDCWTGQNKDRYCKQELSFLLVLLVRPYAALKTTTLKSSIAEVFKTAKFCPVCPLLKAHIIFLVFLVTNL